jgi:hypothetical protein
VADLNFIGKESSSSWTPSITATSANVLSNIISIGAIAAIIGVFVAMGGLFLYYRYQTTYLGDLIAQRDALEDDLRPELVNRLVFVDSLLASTRALLQSHVYASNIVPFLEQNIHRSAVLTNVDLSVDARKLDIQMDVPSYLVFAEQIRVFEASPFVERVSFGPPAPGEKGIGFAVTIHLKPAIFERK